MLVDQNQQLPIKKMGDQEKIQTVEMALSHFKKEEYEKASELTIEILDTNIKDNDLLLSCSSILVNSGLASQDLHIINSGITCITEKIQEIDLEQYTVLGVLEYNLSNAYSAKAELLNKEKELDKYEELIQKQKKCLQGSLLKADHLDLDTLCRAINNYGHLLSGLGRYVEAIDYLYDCIKLNPKHAVAMCNCSSALQKTLNFSQKHNYRIVYEFWRLIHEASQLPTEIIWLSGHEMLKRCQISVKSIEEYCELVHPLGVNGIKNNLIKFESVHSSWEPSSALEKIAEDRLFLTVNPQLTKCVDHYRDDICFNSILTKLNCSGEQRFQRLINVFNHVKEDFATARYLYYESCFASEELSKISSVTYYIETSGFSDFGLKTGFLKTSFRLATDLLDKCAGFINLYLELGHPEDQVTLNNVWYVENKRKKGLHPTIQTLINQNSYLFALKDLNKDLYLGIYPAHIRHLRNEATHKRLVLSLYDSDDEYDREINYDDFKRITFLLLRMSKAAIMSLVGLVQLEENRRNQECPYNENEGGIVSGPNYNIGFGLSDQFNLGEY